MSATCRSCRAPIVWAKTPMGKAIPLDAEAAPQGNVVLRLKTGPKGEDVAYVLAGEALAAARARDSQMHLPHHATCPEAGASGASS